MTATHHVAVMVVAVNVMVMVCGRHGRTPSNNFPSSTGVLRRLIYFKTVFGRASAPDPALYYVFKLLIGFAGISGSSPVSAGGSC